MKKAGREARKSPCARRLGNPTLFAECAKRMGHRAWTATIAVQWKDEWRYWPSIAVGEEDFVADFYIYADDSGKFDSEKCEYTALCGYVSHVSEWHRVGMEWRNCFITVSSPLHPYGSHHVSRPKQRSGMEGYKGEVG